MVVSPRLLSLGLTQHEYQNTFAVCPTRCSPAVTDKPSICFVAPTVYPIIARCVTGGLVGGAEVQQSILARALRDAGYTISILASDFGQPDEEELEGLRFIKIRGAGRAIPVIRYFHPRLTSLWEAMRRAGADIYFQRGAGASTFVTGLFARTHSGKRFVYSVAHDFDVEKPQTRRIFKGRGGLRDMILYRLGLKLANAIVAQHTQQVQACRKWYMRDAVHIPSTYNCGELSCRPSSNVILWVAVLRRWKRPDLFIELARRLPHLHFRMIGGASTAEGDPDAQTFFEQMRTEAQTLPNLEFMGFLPFHEAERHFNEARVFVNTSDHEGFPNTFMQAWARGTPTVSFVDCGARDSEGPVGAVAGSLSDMEEVLRHLTEDEAAWVTASERCRRYFNATHALPAVVARYEELFVRIYDNAC